MTAQKKQPASEHFRQAAPVSTTQKEGQSSTGPAVGVYVGTSGWAYKVWQPAFYPEKLAQKKYLSYYATQLTAVEVNYTFRRLLTEKMIDNWLAEVPADFRFTLKANQWITHYRRLRDADESIQRFLSSIEPLANARRLGPVLFQLPPTAKVDGDALGTVLRSLPKALRTAWEFRHPSWFTDETYAVLREHNAALCIVDRDEGMDPVVQTASFNYFRFRRTSYNSEQKTQLLKLVQPLWAARREVYAFFKHEENPESPLNAQEFLRSLLSADGTRLDIPAYV
jgi:uncharacterized protein YecE (DUF72 family)